MWMRYYYCQLKVHERCNVSVLNGIHKGKGLDTGEEPPCI